MKNVIQLHLKQQQTLAMTPQLSQAIHLLQLPIQELNEFLQMRLEENPYLCLKEHSVEASSNDPVDEKWSLETFENVWDKENFSPRKNYSSESLENLAEIQANPPLRLKSHLQLQLCGLRLHPIQFKIAELLIDDLDNAGYFKTPLEEMEKTFHISPALLQETLKKLQTLEPTGVFARSLGECLKLQLEERGEVSTELSLFLEHLTYLNNLTLQEFSKKTMISFKKCQDFLQQIRKLNPKPGLAYDPEPDQSIVPDLILESHYEGWKIRLNQAYLPAIQLDQAYYSKSKDGVKKTSEKEFVHQYFQSAKWLVQALKQRARHMLSIADAIVQHQSQFFSYGLEYLKPLNLATIAKEVGVHESTVSRIVQDKYIQTPKGTLPLRFFFDHCSKKNTDQTSKIIQVQLSQLIGQENHQSPFSDEDIVGQFERQGVHIARRTVTKYRDILGIPGSSERRRMYSWQDEKAL